MHRSTHYTEISSPAWSSLCRHTIKRPITLSGIGVHTGRAVSVTVSPRGEPLGLMLNGAPLTSWSLESAQWSTQLSHDQAKLNTPEHLLAALYGAGIDDAIIEVNPLESDPSAPIELPILDGSALPYLEALEPTPTINRALNHAPQRDQSQREIPQGYLRELTPLPELEVKRDRCVAQLCPESLPGAQGPLTLRLTTTLCELYPELEELESPELRRAQRVTLLSAHDFAQIIAPARTFGLASHEHQLRSLGLIKGVSEENTLILEADGQARGPLRIPDELAAHKLLDALGDLALTGRRWRGHIEITRGSHALNHAIVARLS